MKQRIKTIVVLVLFFEVVFSMGIHVPVDDPVYLFLERMDVRGFIPEYLGATKPFSRDDISNYLLTIFKKKHLLTLVDQQYLEDFITDYRYEFSEKPHPDLENGKTSSFLMSSGSFSKLTKRFRNRDQEKTHTYIYENGSGLVWFDISGVLRMDMKNQIARPLGGMGVRFRSQLSQHLTFYFDATGYLWQTIEGFKDFPDMVHRSYLQDEPELKAQYFDENIAYFQYYDSKLGSVSLNHERIIWGNSPNSMIFSGNNTPFGFFQWQKRFSNVKYTFIHGKLNSKVVNIDTLTNIKSLPPKYIVGHRLEINILKNVKFTFSDILVYGNRSMEIDYLIPSSLLYTMEHDQRDRDNNLMAFEVETRPTNGLRIYGNLLLDELKITKIMSAWWANKQGVQAGIVLAPRFPAVFRIEWTAVRPWTYTHKIEVNSYTHNGECLGFYAGPNSELLFLENSWRFSHRFSGKCQIRYLKHGYDLLPVTDPNYYPAGGDANQDYSKRNPDFNDNTGWLIGSVEKTREIDLLFTYRYIRELYFDWGLKIQKDDSERVVYFFAQMRIDL